MNANNNLANAINIKQIQMEPTSKETPTSTE